jgi:hypothetical protein
MNQKMFLFYSMLLCLLTMTAKYSHAFPRGCELRGYGNDGEQIVLNQTGAQTYYLMENTSAERIQVQRVETHGTFISPALAIRLEPKNWAAFASNIENFHFQCMQLDAENNAANLIPCSSVLSVCQYPRVRFARTNLGNYWVAYNKSQESVIHETAAKGIYLKW